MKSPISGTSQSTRLEKLRAKIEAKGFDALLVTQAENRLYLSSFTGSAGALLITSDKAILATDSRYTEQAGIQSPSFEIRKIRSDLDKWLPEMLTEFSIKRVGFEAADLSYSLYRKVRESLDKNRNSIQLIAEEGFVEELRMVKEDEEIENLKKAASLADGAIEHLCSLLKPGMTEKEATWEMEKFMREKGSQPIPFELIVASGPSSALPHAKPSDKAIAEGEPVVIDIGAKTGYYCSDMTRTICLGKPSDNFNRIYDIVLGAQLAAMATIEPGMSGDKADSLARTVINEAGYGEAFGHGLGHGIGLALHEGPRLGQNSQDILRDQMVFTVEPGIYIPGWGGIRIEDTVIMENGKIKALTRSPKVNWRK